MSALSYKNPAQYHPYRAREAWQVLLEHCENQHIDFDFYYSTAAEMLTEWGEGRNLTAQDRAMLEDKGWLEVLLEDRCGDKADHTILLDARSIIGTIDTGELDASIFDSFPRTKSKSRDAGYYVHFGPNAFPSPFPGAGVEGAYVVVGIDPENQSGMDVAVTLVCSDPYAAVVDDREPRSAGQRLMDAIRSQTLHLNPEDSADYSWDANVVYYEEKAGDDSNDAQWAAHVRKPMHAALQIMSMHFTKSFEYISAVPEDAPSSMRRVIGKSTSDTHFANAGEDSEHGFAVRYLNAVPVEATREPAALLDEHITPDLVNATVDDAFEMDRPENGLRVALHVAGLADKLELADPAGAFAAMRSTAAVIELALASDDNAAAVVAADHLFQSKLEAADAFLPLAWLAFRLCGGLESRADEVLVRCIALGADREELLVVAEKTIEFLEDNGYEGVTGHFMEHPAHLAFHIGALSHVALETPFNPAFAKEWHNTANVGLYPHVDLGESHRPPAFPR